MAVLKLEKLPSSSKLRSSMKIVFCLFVCLFFSAEIFAFESDIRARQKNKIKSVGSDC